MKKETRDFEVIRTLGYILDDIEKDETDFETLIEVLTLDDFKRILKLAKIGERVPYNVLNSK